MASLLARIVVFLCLFLPCTTLSSIRSSAFHGGKVHLEPLPPTTLTTTRSVITMRKQKASDKRTTRRQRGEDLLEDAGFVSASQVALPPPSATLMTSPMLGNLWKLKHGSEMQNVIHPAAVAAAAQPVAGGGRQRSRKRSTLYNSLAFYHNSFVNQLTFEFKAEVCRISELYPQYAIFAVAKK